MAPEFWQTLISIAEVRKRYCSEIDSCKSKPMDKKFQLFSGTIYIVYVHTHVHVHIEKMGNL